MTAVTAPQQFNKRRDLDRVVLDLHKYSAEGRKSTRSFTARQVIKCVLSIAVFWAAMSFANDKLATWAIGHDNDAIRPSMAKLADAGGDSAAVWLASHYREEYDKRIDGLVAKRIPEAMYMKGRVDLLNKHETAGLNLINEAAKAGYVDAVKYAKQTALWLAPATRPTVE